MMKRFVVYKDDGQWVPGLKWFWYVPDAPGDGHGPYPARWVAWLAGWVGTR